MDSAALFAMMPRARKVRFWHLPFIWYENFGDRRLINDWLSLIIKSLPTIAVIISPIFFVIIIQFIGLIKFHYSNSPVLFWSISSALGGMFSILVIMHRSERVLSRRLRDNDFDSNFLILQYVAFANVISANEVQYAYRYLLKPVKERTEYFDFVFRWTGLGPWQITPRNAKFRALDRGSLKGGFRCVRIDFGKSVPKGEQIVCEFVFHALYDQDSAPDPVIAVAFNSDKYPKLNTHLMAYFNGCEPSSVYREYTYGASYLPPLRNEPLSPNERSIYHWPIRGMRGWIYLLRWEF